MSPSIFRFFTVSVLMCSLLAGRAASAQDIPGNDAFDARDYAGKVLYVDFWASWCGPCLASFPFMARMTDEFEGDLAIVAINVDENRNDALNFLESFDVPFNIVYDPKGELASEFAIPGMPTSYLFDHNGKLLLRHVGFRKSTSAGLRQSIADAVDASRLASQ